MANSTAECDRGSRRLTNLMIAISKLLGHSSVTVTPAIYGHLTAEDARVALAKAGWFTGWGVTW